jgi:hypothetical protein
MVRFPKNQRKLAEEARVRGFRPVAASLLAACALSAYTTPVLAQPAQPAATDARVKQLEDELTEMKKVIEQLKQQERDHEEKLILPVLQQRQEIEKERAAIQAQQQAQTPPPVVVAPPPPPPAPFGSFNLGGLPVKVNGSVILRYDYSTNSDITDLLLDDVSANTFRYRIRLGADFGDPDGIVNGGIRISAAETPNPTVAFASIGDGFRPKQIGFDQWWIQVRPFADRDRLGLIFGKMPVPIWRGHIGTFRSEMIWDNDISPEGLALHVTFFKTPGEKPSFKLDNVAAYYQIEDIQDLRFQGLTGITGMFVDQLKAQTKWVTAALAYYDFENLNNGLSSPAYGNGGASPQAATNAFLLRPGTFWITNNKRNFGPGAAGFANDSFRMINATAQVHIPISAKAAGNPDVYLLADYVHNFSVDRDNDGIRGTIGVRMGDFKTNFHPLNLWFTYGWVGADATLATFADSDLGAGTGYRGLLVGGNYRFLKNLQGQILFMHFDAYPNYENTVQRLFIDILADF